MVLHDWTRWLPCQRWQKHLKTLFSRTKKAFEAESWYSVSRTQCLPSSLKLRSCDDLLRHGQICVLVAVAILEECCMASTDMQWLFYLDERIMDLVLLYSLFCLFDNRLMIPIGFIHSWLVILLISPTIVQISLATTTPPHYPNNHLDYGKLEEQGFCFCVVIAVLGQVVPG